MSHAYPGAQRPRGVEPAWRSPPDLRVRSRDPCLHGDAELEPPPPLFSMATLSSILTPPRRTCSFTLTSVGSSTSDFAMYSIRLFTSSSPERNAVRAYVDHSLARCALAAGSDPASAVPSEDPSPATPPCGS